MATAGKSQLLIFMDELIPTIRTALCDRSVIISGNYVSATCGAYVDPYVLLLQHARGS